MKSTAALGAKEERISPAVPHRLVVMIITLAPYFSTNTLINRHIVLPTLP